MSNFQTGDKVSLTTDRWAYEGVVTGDVYYDTEWSMNRQPVRIVRIYRGPEESSNFYGKDRHHANRREGEIFDEPSYMSWKSGWGYLS
jgi:hypothetical protein